MGLPESLGYDSFFYGPRKPVAEAEQKGSVEINCDALKILDRDELKLGDLNPLIHATDLLRRESVDAVRLTAIEKIDKYNGCMPEVLESTVVFEPNSGKSALRFIARFEVPELQEEQMVLLEELVRETYGLTVRTRTDSKGNDIASDSYPPIQEGEEIKSKTGGWYMGPELSPTSSLHTGLFVYKDLGQVNKENFTTNDAASSKYIIEIREAHQYQTDLVTFITQASVILGKGDLPTRGDLLYETYYDIMRLGLKKVDESSIYGMEHAIDMIRRQLLTPLASPEISRGVKEDPQSVLMIGVPGTGKTLAVEQILQEDTDLFILPIDPFELQKELSLAKEKQRVLPRIAEVNRITGKSVVLHVDDIENMVGSDEVTHSTMLNLMAGIKECGFHIIASTNKPEKIDPALIQPQRFGVLIYCGLQGPEARFEILKIHADMQSMKHGKQLFSSEEARELILGEVVKHTQNFTPRYIADIATIAKSYLIDRIAREKGRRIGLTEDDLEGYTYTVADWEKAVEEVDAKYDKEAVYRRAEELKKFVLKHTQDFMGYKTKPETERRIFSQEVYSRVALLENNGSSA
jgi:AAA+ superfamily predicted ATPase